MHSQSYSKERDSDSISFGLCLFLRVLLVELLQKLYDLFGWFSGKMHSLTYELFIQKTRTQTIEYRSHIHKHTCGMRGKSKNSLCVLSCRHHSGNVLCSVCVFFFCVVHYVSLCFTPLHGHKQR